MTGLLMLTGVAALAALVLVMLAYNHRAELHRRRTVRRAGRWIGRELDKGNPDV